MLRNPLFLSHRFFQVFTNEIRVFSTGIDSDGESGIKTQEKKVYPPNNSLIIRNVTNRNPRNLERLRIAPKPNGWYMEKPGRCYWNKVVLELSSRHVTSKLLHFYGCIPVKASTREWCIQKNLYSTHDITASSIVGQVFARRCLETGILEVYCDFIEESKTKPKMGSFIKALEEAGITLKEPNEIENSSFLSFQRTMERPWEVLEDTLTGEIKQETPRLSQIGWNPITLKTKRIRKGVKSVNFLDDK